VKEVVKKLPIIGKMPLYKKTGRYFNKQRG
jgi:hypothetical protein